MRAPSTQSAVSHVSRVVGTAAGITDILKYGLLAVLFLGTVGIFGWLQLSRGSLTFQPAVGVVIGSVAVYFMVLSRLVRSAGTAAAKATKTMVSRYELMPGGLRIHYAIKHLGHSEEVYTGDIDYSELTEVAFLDFREALAFKRYQLGPDLGLAKKGLSDMMAFMQRKIVRPSYWFDDPASNGMMLKLVGPHLFYLINVSNENRSELLEAYQGNQTQMQSEPAKTSQPTTTQ